VFSDAPVTAITNAGERGTAGQGGGTIIDLGLTTSQRHTVFIRAQPDISRFKYALSLRGEPFVEILSAINLDILGTIMQRADIKELVDLGIVVELPMDTFFTSSAEGKDKKIMAEHRKKVPRKFLDCVPIQGAGKGNQCYGMVVNVRLMNQAAFEGYPSLRMSAVAQTFGTMGEYYLVGESRFQNPQLMCPVPVMITRTSVEKVSKDQIVLELQARGEPILGKIPSKDKLINLLFSYVAKKKPPPESGGARYSLYTCTFLQQVKSSVCMHLL
jgi:hypothetical protein